MRAAQWTTIAGGIEKNLKLNTDAPLPSNAKSLSTDSALVKVEYASINPIDYKLPEFALFRTLKISTPAIPCGDYAGTIVATTLPHLKPGDRVFGRSDPPGFGALGEYMIVSGKENVVALPEGVSMSDASTVGVAGLTAYQCLKGMRPGSKVFINGGSGGTGIFGIQIAKILGCTVTTTCSGPNVELCKSFGADEVIDYRTTNVVDHLKRQGTQYDLLIDNVGAPSPIFWDARHYLKPEGRYITIAGSFTLSSITSMMMMKYLPAWLGGGQRTGEFLLRKSNAEDYARIAEWMGEGKLKVVTEKVYKLEESAEAFASLKTGRSRGKLVVKVAGD